MMIRKKLTYLIFLKMSNKYSLPLYNRNVDIPAFINILMEEIDDNFCERNGHKHLLNEYITA